MSVMTFTSDEIADVYGQYAYLAAGATVRDLGLPDLEDVGAALVAFHYANIATYSMQYAHHADGSATFEPVAAVLAKQGMTGFIRMNLAEGQRRLVRTIRHMLYNTVTNAGADFMPSGHRATLERVCVGLAEHLAGL